MKKIYFLLLLAGILSHNVLLANHVNESEALQIATKFVNNNLTSNYRSANQKQLYTAYVSKSEKSSLRSTSLTDSTTNYYVFNVSDNSGYVIVAGNKLSKPIIGYTLNGSFNKDSIPLALSDWLKSYEEELAFQISLDSTPTTETIGCWERISNNIQLRSVSTVIAPLLTTQWSQGDPFNFFCPKYDGTNKSEVGCAATAMAQIMKFYNYPTISTSSSEAYTTSQYNLSIAAYIHPTFKWQNMLNNYYGTSTLQQDTAVAQLLYACATSVQSDFGSNTSASFVDCALAFMNKFGYDKSLKRCLRDYYTDSQWKELIKQELINNRPVLYSGESTTVGAHGFVCDGIDANGLFHFNWGWAGSCDGYYDMSALNPDLSVSNGFTKYNEIYTNLMPNQNGVAEDPAKGIRLGKCPGASKNTVNKNEYFAVYVSPMNDGLAQFSNYIGVALVNQQDSILEILSSSNEGIGSNTGYSEAVDCKIPTTTAAGKYALKIVAKDLNNKWIFIPSKVGCLDSIPIELLSVTQPFNICLTTTLTSSVTSVHPSTNFTCSAEIINPDNSSFSGYISVGVFNSKDSLLDVIGTSTYVYLCSYGCYDTYSVQCAFPQNYPSGTYKLRVIAKNSSSSWFTVKSQYSTVDKVSMVLNNASAIKNENADNVKVYLDMESKNIIIEKLAEDAQLRVYDANGKQCFSKQIVTGTQVIPVSFLPDGVYLVRITTPTCVYNKKLIKK